MKENTMAEGKWATGRRSWDVVLGRIVGGRNGEVSLKN